jgi:hypothetical protein
MAEYFHIERFFIFHYLVFRCISDPPGEKNEFSMKVLFRRGAVYALFTLLGSVPFLSVVAQHDDTVVAGTEDTATVSGSSAVDSESPEQAAAKSDPVVFRSIPDSVITRWKKDKQFAYANDPSYWKRANPGAPRTERLNWLERLLNSEGFTWFIYLLLGAILLYAILRIVSENNMRVFYRSPGKTAGGLAAEANPLQEDLDLQLKEALGAGDHRLAVRWLYLRSLRLLNDRALIRYHVDATNREYVRQLTGSAAYESFLRLTGAYERVWYGELPLGEESFGRLYQYFQDFYKSIGH